MVREDTGQDTGEDLTEAKARRFGWVRRHRALSVLIALALVLLVAVGGWAAYLNSRLADIPRFDLDVPNAADRPARVESEAVNVLLVGVDARDQSISDALSEPDWPAGEFRSDVLMVLHLDADRQHAQVVSFPRDSWVDVPGHGMQKINAAFSYGGPSLAIQTVEQVSGLRLDHVAVIDFAGFQGLTDALGGVEVTIAEDTVDGASGYTWTKGVHTLDGEDALRYVRQREGLLRGDLDRAQRQQAYLRAVLTKLADTGVLGRPLRLTRVAGELSDFVSVDADWSTGDLRSLALSARGLNADSVDFVTVPVTGTPTIGTQSVVTLDAAGTRALFRAVGDDEFPSWRRHHEVETLPSPDQVR